MKRFHVILLLGLGLLIGGILGSQYGNPGTDSGQMPPNNMVDSGLQTDSITVENLRRSLESERQARQQLSLQVNDLSSQLARLMERIETAAPMTPTQLNRRPPVPEDDAVAGSLPDLQRRDLLVQAGLESAQADALVSELETLELDALYLRNRALREGWKESNRYKDEQGKLDSPEDLLQRRLGEDGYDKYLFAQGQPNRVRVSSTISGGPADTAGIQKGDIILRYGEKRIYQWGDLTDATTKGQEGENIWVRVLRQNATLDLTVPRGPLGVRLEFTRLEPGS